MFYKALFYSSALLVAATAWAFGGGGSNRTQQYYERGVDAIGIHRDINGEQGEIDFDDTCSTEEHKEYNAQGVCVCMDGYERDDKVCILACPEHATRNPETKECACDTGYGKDSDDKCVVCPANSANDGDTSQETDITGCYCNSGYEWDSTECKVSCQGELVGQTCCWSYEGSRTGFLFELDTDPYIFDANCCPTGTTSYGENTCCYDNGYNAAYGNQGFNKTCCVEAAHATDVAGNVYDGGEMYGDYCCYANGYATDPYEVVQACCEDVADGIYDDTSGTPVCCQKDASGNKTGLDVVGNSNEACTAPSPCYGKANGTSCSGSTDGVCYDGECKEGYTVVDCSATNCYFGNGAPGSATINWNSKKTGQWICDNGSPDSCGNPRVCYPMNSDGPGVLFTDVINNGQACPYNTDKVCFDAKCYTKDENNCVQNENACGQVGNTSCQWKDDACVLVSCPPLEQTTCEAMPHCHWSGSACLDPCTTGMFHSLSGKCTSCTATAKTETTAKACAVCGDARKVVVNDDKTYCATTDCGADKFQASTGMCYSCTASTGYYVESKEACETPCADRVAIKQGDGRWKCDKAEACSENEVRDPTTRECVCAEGYNKDCCPKDKPILSSSGRCFPCPYLGETIFSLTGTSKTGFRTAADGSLSFSGKSQADCQKCGDEYVYRNGQCEIETCPTGYFEDASFGCRNCQSGWYLHLHIPEIDSCLATCSNRSYTNDGYGSGNAGMGCTLPCPEPLMRDRWGFCLDCTKTEMYWDKGNGTCNMCPEQNFVNVVHSDRCELLSSCPEGEHLGACCAFDEIYIETSKVKNYKNADVVYSSGICCPVTRPYLINGVCSRTESAM